MKLLFCRECRVPVAVINEVTNKCKCGKTAGKYLSDNVTAVVTEDSVVFGIDNNSFLNALMTATRVCNGKFEAFDTEKRYDFFFTGWIPTKPGEVIFVKNSEEVDKYKYETELNWTSENPNTGVME